MDDFSMTTRNNTEFIDIHRTLLRYSEVLAFFERLERSGDVKSYCNGANAAGRWIFQIYNKEFIEQLVAIINEGVSMIEDREPILEVMSGDGRLSEFLKPSLQRDIITTDAKDGRYDIEYPKWVETLDAIESVEKYQPSLVIISWEPYLSMSGIEIVRRGIPTVWIGNPVMCGHPDIFENPHLPVKSRYALSRHDSFSDQNFKTDIFLFNYDDAWLRHTN